MWCRVHPGVGFSVSVKISPYCAIILPKNDFKTYFITTCKYQRCPIPWQKIYKCCFILFSIFWKTTMMFMWCIVFQLVAIIKKNTSCGIFLWLFLFTEWKMYKFKPCSVKNKRRKERISRFHTRSTVQHFNTRNFSTQWLLFTGKVRALWDWRAFNLLSRLTPIINLTYSPSTRVLS